MSKIERFEDLEIWQKSREICNDIFEIGKKTSLKTDYKLYNQINGSSGSIMDNMLKDLKGMETRSLTNSFLLPKPLAEKHGHNFITFWTENI